MAVKNEVVVDFSDVKESSGINPKHQEEGDYLLRIISADQKKTKDGDPMVLFLLQDVNLRGAVYPYYCPLTPKMLWKIRNLFIAAGQAVPKAKGKLDLNKVTGKEVGVTLADDEYEGRMRSTIDAVFHKDELEPTDDIDDVEDEVEDEEIEEDEVEEEAPAPKAKKKAAPAPVEEEDDEEDEEDEEEEPAPAPVKKKAKAKPAPVEEEDDDDLDLDDI